MRVSGGVRSDVAMRIKRCIIGLAAGMALALSQAQAMDRDNVFDAFIAQVE